MKPLFAWITWVYTFCHMAKDIREYFKQSTPRLPTVIIQSAIDVVKVELSKFCSYDKTDPNSAGSYMSKRGLISK